VATLATQLERARREPWSFRLFERLGFEPVWLGLAAGMLLATAATSLEAAMGHVARVLAGELPTVVLRAPVVASLLIGLLPAGQFYLARWTERHLDQITLLMDGDRTPSPASAHPSRRAGTLGTALFIALFILPGQNLKALADGSLLSVHRLYPWVMVGTLGWLMGRFLHSMLLDALRVSRLAAQLRRVDLLDLQPLAPFVQQGLSSALLMVLLFSITSVLALSPGETFLTSSVIVTVAMLLASVAVLLLPARGVRARIRAEKQRQLAVLRASIDADRRAVLDGRAETERVVRLPGLLALEARLESVREWPFDPTSLARYGLYVLVGLGSWVGAAAVERLLDRAVG
jgi:hypothetical protein